MEEIDHGPEMAALFDVHLKQISEIVQAGAALSEPSLLLDACRLRISLRHDQAAQLVSELAGYFLPDGLSGKVAESNASIVHRIGEKNAPPIFRQLDVFEMGP